MRCGCGLETETAGTGVKVFGIGEGADVGVVMGLGTEAVGRWKGIGDVFVGERSSSLLSMTFSRLGGRAAKGLMAR